MWNVELSARDFKDLKDFKDFKDFKGFRDFKVPNARMSSDK